MKKLVFVVLALFFVTCSAFAAGGALNLKLGVGMAGYASYGDNGSGSNDVKTGVNVAGEYLFKLSNVIKLGAGVEYLIPREIDGSSGNYWPENPKISYMPIYLSLELTPFSGLREFYLKGNLGYNAIFNLDTNFEKLSDQTGGVYFALGVGYVFDFGLILEGLYDFYYGSGTSNGSDVSVAYGQVGLNVGYRFNI